jgi:hypothetical protein
MPWNEVMGKFKRDALRSSSGRPVKKRKQAIAIMLSEKRAAEGGKQEYMKSNLPSGVSQTPKGDLGQHRGVEAKIAGAGKFKGSKIMHTAAYFKGGK